MNADFTRLLAQRLERVPWVDVRLAECAFPESFEGVDGFFMGADLMRFEGTSEVFDYQVWRLGSIEAWAVQLIREQGGYYDSDNTWVAAPQEIEPYDINELAWRALGLGREGLFEDTLWTFILDGHVADALLSPPFLHGRMRGISPAAAAAVLIRCADGMAPQDAWALAAQDLRVWRLRKLADVLEKTPHAFAAAWDEPTPDWTSEDLDKLTHFSMLSRFRPSVMSDGNWCGDLAMWAWKLFGADAEFYFGKEANVGLVASITLGLTPYEGSALFEASVSPAGWEDFDEAAFCGGLTPELAAKALRGIADGVFASFMWDDLRDEVGLDEWMEEILGYRLGNGKGSLPGGDYWAVDGATQDDKDDC